MRLLRLPVRLLFTAVHRLRKTIWRLRGPGLPGTHALPITSDGRLVLVRLTYAPGWRLPGGGLKRGEDPLAGVLRELREEIGLIAHDSAERLPDVQPETDLPGDRSALLLIRGVVYRPRWSFEVEEVGAFAPRDLPPDTARWTRAMVEKFLS